jgi:hypothetical protein
MGLRELFSGEEEMDVHRSVMDQLRHEGFRFSVEYVSPERAKILLASQAIPNRKIRDQTAAQYAQDMTDNNWHFTHQGLCLSPDGDGIHDGRHRLVAVANSGKGQWFLICYGESPMEALDAGRKRTVGDDLACQGIYLPTNGAPLIAAILRGGDSNFTVQSLSRGEVETLYDGCKDIVDIALDACARSKDSGLRLPSSAAAAIGRMSRWYEVDVVDRVITVFCDNRAPESPGENTLYNFRKLQNAASMSVARHFGAKTDQAMLYRKMTVALQAFIADRELKMFRLPNVWEDPFPLRDWDVRAVNARSTDLRNTIRSFLKTGIGMGDNTVKEV